MPHIIRLHIREGALPMLDGETLEAFREAIVFALREDYEARGVITRDEQGMRMGWLYLMDVFDDFAVVEVDQPGGSAFEKVTFTRAPDGTFTLGDPVRVRRKVEWEPIGDDVDEGATLPDREREIRIEITAETIGGVRFPVGDLDGVRAAITALCHRDPEALRANRGALQSVEDRTLARIREQSQRDRAIVAANAR